MKKGSRYLITPDLPNHLKKPSGQMLNVQPKNTALKLNSSAKLVPEKNRYISEKIEKRSTLPGIVHIISAMEGCNTYKPWQDKTTGKTFLRQDTSKCLHYYFYFIDEQVGLGYVRVPTWCPFRLQVYVKGHSLLASELKQARIN